MRSGTCTDFHRPRNSPIFRNPNDCISVPRVMKTKTFPQLTMIAAFGWAVFALPAFSQALNPVASRTNTPAYKPGELLIKFKTGASDTQLQDAVTRAGASTFRQIHTRAMKDRGDRGITHADTAKPVDEALEALKNHPAVEYAQPNGVTTPMGFKESALGCSKS